MLLPPFFLRFVFLFLSTLFAMSYAVIAKIHPSHAINLATGLLMGVSFWLLLVGMETLFKRINIRLFNTATAGIFFGYLMGQAVWLLFQTGFDVSLVKLSVESSSLIKSAILLTTTYIAMMMTARAADELSLSIPFFKFKQHSKKKKDLLIDTAVLADPRIIDLAMSGLLDHILVLPRFIVKECNESIESQDEGLRIQARRCLDNIKKLESITSLEMRFADNDYQDVADPVIKLLRIARLLDANILTADASKLQQSFLEGIRLINIHHLSTTLKPVAQTGETLNIKIQRIGKEPRQGVGYLEDGTMVVVNGGAEFIGETIKAHVLSVKHTSSGRMIFCNAFDIPFNMDLMHTPLGNTATELAKTYAIPPSNLL